MSWSVVPPLEVPDRVEVPSPVKVAITRTDGGRAVGPWSGFDLQGISGPDSSVRWEDITPPDRLRLGRLLIRASGSEAVEAWALLIAALELSDAPDMADRARDRCRSLARDREDVRDEAVRRIVEEARRKRERAAAAVSAATLRVTRPHLEPVRSGGSAVPAPRPGRIPAEIEQDRAALRRIVDTEIGGLGLEIVPTAHTITAAAGTLEEVAAIGVRSDRMLAITRQRLGLAPDAPLPAGGLAIVDPGDSDDARVLMARHLVDWPEDEPSMLLPRPEGWLAVLAEPAPEPLRRWAATLPDGRAEMVWREVEQARIAARVAMLDAGGGRVPAWMVEGFAEAAAQAIVEVAPLERFGRGPAVAAIRSGRHPGWIATVPPGDRRWSAEGEARRTAHLLMSRLLESSDATVPGIVRDLSAGVEIDDAFRRWTGRSVSGWFDDAADWYLTND